MIAISGSRPRRLSGQKSFQTALEARRENAWQMELDGPPSVPLKMDELFLSVWPGDDAMPLFATADQKGRWQYDALTAVQKAKASLLSQLGPERVLSNISRATRAISRSRRIIQKGT